MSLPYDFVNASTAAVEAEVEGVVSGLRRGTITDEENFTSQMLSAMRSALVRTSIRGFAWTSSIHDKRTKEPATGADFAGLLTIEIPDYSVRSGFLAQAKMAGPRKRIDRARLRAQAEHMLSLSPASYVFLYRPDGVAVVPAIAVSAADGDPRELDEWTLGEFFTEHVHCFVGDRGVELPGGIPPGELLEDFQAQRVLIMSASLRQIA
jgi:hypothetical protein